MTEPTEWALREARKLDEANWDDRDCQDRDIARALDAARRTALEEAIDKCCAIGAIWGGAESKMAALALATHIRALIDQDPMA